MFPSAVGGMPSRILVEGQMNRQLGVATRIQAGLAACEIDEELRPFLAPLRSTVRHPHLVVALQLWRRASNLSLLPFHLHLRWPDEIAHLPLFTSVSLAPFFSADVEQAELMPLYSVREAHEARTRARRARYREGRDLPDDFVFADWEDGFKRHPELGDLVLPGASFVAIDRISQTNAVKKGSRPRLGKYCEERAAAVPARAWEARPHT